MAYSLKIFGWNRARKIKSCNRIWPGIWEKLYSVRRGCALFWKKKVKNGDAKYCARESRGWSTRTLSRSKSATPLCKFAKSILIFKKWSKIGQRAHFASGETIEISNRIAVAALNSLRINVFAFSKSVGFTYPAGARNRWGLGPSDLAPGFLQTL